MARRPGNNGRSPSRNEPWASNTGGCGIIAAFSIYACMVPASVNSSLAFDATIPLMMKLS